LFPLLSWVIAEELPWCEIARRFGGIDPKTARAWSVTAIAALAAVPDR
jgi:hypothetical protein